MTRPRAFRWRPVPVLVIVLLASGCGGPETMIASSLLSAAMRTAMDQAIAARPSPEQMWHEAQVASLEQRALNGDSEAQFQIGTYYLMLQEPIAERWICEAANRGHARAQLQYGHWFNEDRLRDDLFPFIAVAPDNTRAFLWYSLAADSGEPRAPHFRDALSSSGLSDSQVRLARTELSQWSPHGCGELAAIVNAINDNEPPAAR